VNRVGMAPTAFLGLSHLGVISSIGWASMGESVTAVDLDPSPVAKLQAGQLPVLEPSLDELFAATRARMTFSTDSSLIRDASLVVVARDVPTDAGNASDLSAVNALIDAAIPHLHDGVTLVVMSQVPPGFMRGLAELIRTRRPKLGFHLYYWIETLIFGNAVERFLKPERIMLGCADPTASLPPALEAGVGRFQAPVFRMRYESAELTKTAINLYLCAAVTYANTLSDLCEAVGADWSEMTPALRLDRRIGPAAYIRPGLGIAGGNLERDLVTLRNLCRSHGVDSTFIDAMIDYNDRRYQWVQRKLDVHVFSAVSRPVLAVWGLAYKRNTRSTKNSMALRVINDVGRRVEVRAWDPAVGAGDVDVPAKIVGDAAQALDGADALLILTDWPEFAAPAADALSRMRRRVVIDGVGIVDRQRTDLRNVTLVSMGLGE
jgi:UDPglucose 6-dehydrogenase